MAWFAGNAVATMAALRMFLLGAVAVAVLVPATAVTLAQTRPNGPAGRRRPRW